MRVLLVEDEAPLADVVARGLRGAGLAIDLATDGETAIQAIEVTSYDVVVLDRQLPGLHGDDVCRFAIARERPPRVLMLTASGTLDDRVRGLEIGADDYLPKPFAMAELIARVQALGRRPSTLSRPVLEFSDVRVDTNRRQVTRGGRALDLTRKELGVLEVLA